MMKIASSKNSRRFIQLNITFETRNVASSWFEK